MTNTSILKTVLTVFSLMLIFSVSAFAQKTDCSKITDAEIVEAIYKKIEVKYADQTQHINIRIKDGVVILEGWTTTKSVRKEIEKIAKKTVCVKKVENKLTIGIGGGCAAGQKPCGDICIPSDAVCNIRTKGN